MTAIKDFLIPLKKAPEVIPIPEKTLRNWRSQGLYPQIFVKLGGTVFIHLGEFRQIIIDQQDEARE